MKRLLLLGALCATIACASSPPDVLAHPDGIASVTPGDASPMQPFTLASLDVAVVPAFDVEAPAIVAPTDSEVRTGDTGERKPDSGDVFLNEKPSPQADSRRLPASIHAYVAEPVEPFAALRSPAARLSGSSPVTSARVLRIDRDPSRIGGAIEYGALRPGAPRASKAS